MRHHGTDIDGLTLHPEALHVRGRPLNELVGRCSYPAAVFHLLAGRLPSADEEGAVDARMAEALAGVDAGHPMPRTARRVRASGAGVVSAWLASLMADRALPEPDPRLAEAGLDAARQEGLAWLGLAPLLLAHAAAGADRARVRALDARVRAARARPVGFTVLLHQLLAGLDPRDGERAALDAVLVAMHAGFGFLTPTVLSVRAAASTGSPLATCLAAGLAAAGPAHVGACREAMAALDTMASAPSPAGGVDAWLARARQAGVRVPGFGHPVFHADPRVPRLRAVVTELGIGSRWLACYDRLAARLAATPGIHPNIDAIGGAVFLTLGIAPALGTGVFLCARMAAMLAHALEMKERPPFGARSGSIRAWIDALPPSGAEYALLGVRTDPGTGAEWRAEPSTSSPGGFP